MASRNEIKFGVVGVCGGYGRGSQLINSLRKTPPIHVQAVCDVAPERVARASSTKNRPLCSKLEKSPRQ